MEILPKTKRSRQRLFHHLWLAIGSLGLPAIIYFVLSVVYPSPKVLIFRLSLATAYIATGLLAVTLSLSA